MQKAYPNPPSAQASEEDKRKWQGFCEIESEPAYFNVMLNEFGVRGVKIRELYMLDMLGELPQPVYGLILLFRYREVDSEQQEESCPEHVWFANQTANNACATVAMLNIVMNVPGLELGENIQSFKEFTGRLSPLYRGEQLAHFEFVKHIHNSFAKKSDMLNGDLSMKNRFDAKDKKKQKKRKLEDYDEDDAAFHFIAYVPIQGSVWKLDGLDFQPTNIGSFEGSDWFPVVHKKVGALMNTDDLNYTLLAVVKDPIEGLRSALSENINTIKTVEARLDSVSQEWRSFTDGNDDALEEILRGPSEELGITIELLDSAVAPAPVARKIEADDDAGTLVERRDRLFEEHVKLRAAIREEAESSRVDLVKAAKRRHDYGPLIQTWLRMLADKGELEGLVARNK
ncbi:cysteine proteinase [Glonium stellatum]|uniref:Ubiquitin carboxyl-terminal hydrolase n=1 Tax=Glonium stellatum TaxID=574774 RepID=A0A8E2EVC6_9PEZI|nr:cysteine proteinase [Glonium stellatum]